MFNGEYNASAIRQAQKAKIALAKKCQDCARVNALEPFIDCALNIKTRSKLVMFLDWQAELRDVANRQDWIVAAMHEFNIKFKEGFCNMEIRDHHGEKITLKDEKTIRLHTIGPKIAELLGAKWVPIYETMGDICSYDFRLSLGQYLNRDKLEIRVDSMQSDDKKHNVIARDCFDYKTRDSIKLDISVNPTRTIESITRDIQNRLIPNAKIAFIKQKEVLNARIKADNDKAQREGSIKSLWPEVYQGNDTMYITSNVGSVNCRIYSGGEINEIKINPENNEYAFKILAFIKSLEQYEGVETKAA